jgi:predicted dehydrogenase
VGTQGKISLDPAFVYDTDIKVSITSKKRTQLQKFEPSDQFAPLLIYFSRCILENKQPEPSGRDGWSDVRVMEAISNSLKSRSVERLEPAVGAHHPHPEQLIQCPAVKSPKLIRAHHPAL